jgi:hypothetical protein
MIAMQIIIYLLIALLVTPLYSKSAQRYWVFFSDKGQFEELSLLEQTDLVLDYVSPKAMERRLDRAPENFDEGEYWSDLPLDDQYLAILKSSGFIIHGRSRWFNAVSGTATPENLKLIASLPFVKTVKPVRRWTFSKANLTQSVQSMPTPSTPRNPGSFNYGPSLTQTVFHKIDSLHEKHLNGEGVIIGVFDTGFRLVNPTLQHIPSQLIAEYDFVQMDSITSNEEGDRSDQDAHGTLILSILGGFQDGQLIGPAYNAKFLLAKTEKVDEEIHLEEDNWAMAAEWAERLGVDIVNSSLGYSIFDPKEGNYSYQDMDGKTTIVTRAANKLANLGVLVVNSAGNEGSSSWHYITAPADGFYVLSVGALNSYNQVAGFSSRGPTADGRIKPDVAALGIGVYGASTGPLLRTASGTSVSSALVTGIAAQILQSKPHLNLLYLFYIMKNSGDNAQSPDNERGWGKVDALKAWSIANDTGFGLPEVVEIAPPQPNPYVRGNGLIFFSANLPESQVIRLEIFNMLGQKIAEKNFNGSPAANLFPWDARNSRGNAVAAGIYIFRVSGPTWQSTGKFIVLN